MRSIADRALWIGNAGDLRNPVAILDAGIEAVIELADSEPLATLPRELIRCRFPLSDDGNNPYWLLRIACETVAGLLRANVPTMVCCSFGMSRSVCVAAGGISLAERRSLRKTLIAVIDGGPTDVTPGFLVQLQNAIQSDD